MIRLTLIEILFFSLPALVFFAWRWQGEDDHISRPAPVTHLLWAGLASAILVFVALSYFSGKESGHEGEQYVAPHVVDGVVIPGYFIPIEEDVPYDPEEATSGSDPN
jgi:hypothetical protein